MDAFEYLEGRLPDKPLPVYVLAGEEQFLKAEVLFRLKEHVLGKTGADLAFSVRDGSEATFADIQDELATLPFLAPCRIVVVRDADSFVTRCRESLEKYCQSPAPHGVLVLDVKSWRSNTRLARLVPSQGVIECSLPEYEAGKRRVRGWLVRRCSQKHGEKLAAEAVDFLLECHGTDLGVLDQELAKLAAYVGDAAAITVQDVQRLTSRTREVDVWPIFDLLARGDQVGALRLLGELIEQGNEPMQLLGALSWQLRRLAQVYYLRRRGIAHFAAVKQAGLLRPEQAEQLLRRLGPRAEQLYDWLLDADLRLKSSSDLPPRAVLERLVARLAS